MTVDLDVAAPFDEDNLTRLRNALAPPMPTALRRLLVRGLAPRPEDRFESMQALRQALVRAGEQPGPALADAAVANRAPRSIPRPLFASF